MQLAREMSHQALDRFEAFIRRKVEEDHASHAQISEELIATYPGEKGFSERSVRRFCQDKNIHKTSRMSQPEVNRAVAQAVLKVSTVGMYNGCMHIQRTFM